jgi:iron-sulfur cluster insertion protein|tara:strand:- start:2062 stop:2406 length:345 start_codon:yes stop_codon:yes gene_type:complete
MDQDSFQSLNLTDNAVSRIKNVMTANVDLGSKFRVYVTGGGCSGFQYGFKFDPDVAFDDDVIEFENFSVLLDSMSYPYLFGSTLDFIEDLSGSKFVINNPNAKTTCGCGESFTI